MAKSKKRSKGSKRPSAPIQTRLQGNKLVITVQLSEPVADLLRRVEELRERFEGKRGE